MINKNHGNQYTPDAREQVCWDFYLESIIKGLPNAYESAIKAGYAIDTARNITLNGWFKARMEDLERKEMLSKAEKKLAKTLTYEVERDNEIRTDLLRIQVDVSKHLTSTLGKDKGYSSRTEQTGKDGKDLIPEALTEEEKIELRKLLGK